jgi:hypothetical protein
MASIVTQPQQQIAARARSLIALAGKGWRALFPPAQRDEQQAAPESNAFNIALQIALWTAFGAFLLASLPHVAYFFAAHEPEDNGQVADYWWFVSYALAVAIDVTAFLLSLNVAIKMRRATAGLPWYQKILPALGVILTHWPFILMLVGFSWLVNFEHAKQFQSDMLDLAGQVQINLLIWRGTLHDLNPMIASAFPVLAVAYTGMADTIRHDHKQCAPVVAQQTQAPASHKPEPSDLEKILTTMQAMNAQNLQAMQQMTQQSLNVTIEQFTRVTVEAVREVVEALPVYSPAQLPAPDQSEQTEGVNQPMGGAEIDCSGEQQSLSKDDIEYRAMREQLSYGEQIEALYKRNPDITVSDIVAQLSCSRATAAKWLGRVKPAQ